MTRKQLIAARILFAVYLVALAILCFGNFNDMPGVQQSFWGIPTDKIAHCLMFLPFPCLAYLAFNRFTAKRPRPILWIFVTFFVGIVLAAGTEIGQAKLTSWRTGDPVDFRADLIGLAAGTLFVIVIHLWKHRNG